MMSTTTTTTTIETMLDQVEAILAEHPETPPRPDLALPDDYEDGTPQYLMRLEDNGLKGRGWFAKDDIPAGTVLVCEKPMVMVMDWQDPYTHDEFEANRNAVIEGDDGDDDDDDEMGDTEDEAGLSKLNELLLLELLRAIGHNPSLWTDKLSTLFPRTDDDLEVLNSWVCKDDQVFVLYEQLLEQLTTSAILPEGAIKDISKRLPLVVRYNVLSAETSPELMVHPSAIKGYAALSGTALYHLPSFFNHDCQPNASRYAIGDVLFVVTNQDVAAGDELCLSYLEHDVLCEPASTRTLLLNMDFMEPEMEGQEEAEDEGPELPVVDVDVQNELMQMDPMERLVTLDTLMKQALGEAGPEDDDNGDIDNDEMNGIPWFDCDVQNLRILKALTFDSLGRAREALALWETSVAFCTAKLPPSDEASVVVHVQAALCALQCGYHDKARQHARSAVSIHHVLFGGGVARFKRRYEREFQLALRPTVIGGADDLWVCHDGEDEELLH